MNERSKNVSIIIICILAVVLIILSGYILFSQRSGTSDQSSDDISNTIQQIETNNESARRAVNEATGYSNDIRTELDGGQADINNAQQSAYRLSESADKRSELIEEANRELARSRELITEERGIFKDIDEANGLTETQAKSEGASK